MPEYVIGIIPEVQEGDHFPDRKALREAKIHLVLQAGIDGNPKEGCTSIVLNGGYIDDYDLGNEIIYTRHGGNDPNSKKQISYQDWNATGNKALIVSEMHGIPVRVTRGSRHKSRFSPKTGYEYGGLYSVTDHFEETGKDGFLICRFKLNKITTEVYNLIQTILPSNNSEIFRIPTTILRIVRQTSLALRVKRIYDYTCQICGIVISVNGVKYAEAAHIRPLGRPHDGQDQLQNLLCLCPNHHVMLDKGVLAINHDFTLKGIDGILNLNNDHELDLNNIEYHCQHIFIG